MASRWAYEALAVNQFENNAYQKPLFSTEMLESNINYDMQFLVPAITQEIEDALSFLEENREKELSASLRTIENAFASITLSTPYPNAQSLVPDQFSASNGKEAIRWLQNYQSALRDHRDKLSRRKDLLIDSLMREAGGKEAYVQKKREYHNEQLAQLVLNRNELHKLIKRDGLLIRKMDPVYTYPAKRNGRAHFYASVKRLGETYIPTRTFNLLAIWAMILVLYALLRYRVLYRAIEYSGNLRGSRSARS
jgi:hypothetical protein